MLHSSGSAKRMSRGTSRLQLLPGLGQRLREERERLDMTQAELAARLTTARRTIINHECDAYPVPLRYLDQLAQLGADWLFMLFGRRQSEFPGVPDPRILEEVIEWAELLCKDRNGKPFSPRYRAKFISQAYEFLASDHETETSQEITETALLNIARKFA